MPPDWYTSLSYLYAGSGAGTVRGEPWWVGATSGEDGREEEDGSCSAAGYGLVALGWRQVAGYADSEPKPKFSGKLLLGFRLGGCLLLSGDGCGFLGKVPECMAAAAPTPIYLAREGSRSGERLVVSWWSDVLCRADFCCSFVGPLAHSLTGNSPLFSSGTLSASACIICTAAPIQPTGSVIVATREHAMRGERKINAAAGRPLHSCFSRRLVIPASYRVTANHCEPAVIFFFAPHPTQYPRVIAIAYPAMAHNIALVSNKRRRTTPAGDAACSASTTPPTAATKPSADAASLANPVVSTALSAPTVHVVAGSKIQAKVRAAIVALSTDTTAKPSHPDVGATAGAVKPTDAKEEANGIVLFEARAPAANKMITIVEIVKRTLNDEKRPWWAYTSTRGVLEEFDSSRKATASNERQAKGDGDPEGGSDDEEAFESPPADRTGPFEKKVRNVPILMLYLATKPVPTLRMLHGEQCSKA